ncbi:MAG: ParA family protein [Pseudomonadota bacterium]
MGEVISIVNRKGGVGKTTLTVGLAETLVSDRENSVIVVDLDPQASATHMLSDDDKHYGAITAAKQNLVGYFENSARPLAERVANVQISERHSLKKRRGVRLDLIGNSDEFWDLEANRLRQNAVNMHKQDLYQLLAHLRKQFDYVLIDCPPGQSISAEAALQASDLILCPITPDKMALWGKELLTKYVSRVAPDRIIRFVVTRAIFNTSLAADMFVEIDQHDDMLPADEGVFRFAYFSQSAHVTRRLTIDKPNRTLEQLWGKQAARELRQIMRQVEKTLLEARAPESTVAKAAL